MSAASTQGLSTASRPSVDPKGSPSCRPHRSPRATRAVLGVALLVPLTAAGCEVSVFGGAPVSLLGGGSVESGGEARACSEPDDARAARRNHRETVAGGGRRSESEGRAEGLTRRLDVGRGRDGRHLDARHRAPRGCASTRRPTFRASRCARRVGVARERREVDARARD